MRHKVGGFKVAVRSASLFPALRVSTYFSAFFFCQAIFEEPALPYNHLRSDVRPSLLHHEFQQTYNQRCNGANHRNKTQEFPLISSDDDVLEAQKSGLSSVFFFNCLLVQSASGAFLLSSLTPSAATIYPFLSAHSWSCLLLGILSLILFLKKSHKTDFKQMENDCGQQNLGT